jgi:hypothetical protein
MATPNSFWQQSRGKGGLDQMDKWAADTKAGKLAPVGTTPYVAGLASYKPMDTYKSGRSRLDPTRIAEKMARGNARPGEIAAAQLMQRQQAIDAEMPITQAKADEARFTSSILADPEYQDVLRKRMMTILSPEEEQKKGNLPNGTAVPPTMVDPPAGQTPETPMTPEQRNVVTNSFNRRNPAVVGPKAEGGEMEMGDDEGGEGEEDAYLLGEEGPEMVIKRDDGSMFVLPADVTEKIMAGITMDDTEENQDAMAAAMQRMGMEPKMGGGKMKPYMKGGKMGTCMCGGKMGSCMCGGKMKARMGGGTMMAQETGRMAPKSRTQTRKNTLFDAMKKLV